MFRGPSSTELTHLSLNEFTELANELAPKVNMFSQVWRFDREAEFIGGTSRDYLLWLMGKFRGAHSKEEVEAIKRELRAREVIDVREFIIGDSDVDILSKKHIYSVSAERYGVRKLDFIKPDRFVPGTPEYTTEINQGFIPIEKIRLGRNGLIPNDDFGDGVAELFEGKMSLHYTPDEVFEKTLFAARKHNHKILLALRYIRLRAMYYYQVHGKDYPDRRKLLDIPEEVDKAIKDVVKGAMENSSLRPYLQERTFTIWLNSTIQKAFRSYSNQTAAKMLMEHYGVDRLISYYEEIQSTNNYLFVRKSNPAKLERTLNRYSISEDELLDDTAKHFPDGKFHHGTPNIANLRNIVLQGAMPSKDGVGGRGLYGVATDNFGFALENYAAKDEKRMVELKIADDARVVDLTKNEKARRIWIDQFNKDYEKFAEAFEVDIIKYPYTGFRGQNNGNVDAYVIKNSAAIVEAQGFKVKILPLERIIEFAKTVTDENIGELTEIIRVNRLASNEVYELLRNMGDVTLESKLEFMTDFEDFDIASAKLMQEIEDDDVYLKFVSKILDHYAFEEQEEEMVSTVYDDINAMTSEHSITEEKLTKELYPRLNDDQRIKLLRDLYLGAEVVVEAAGDFLEEEEEEMEEGVEGKYISELVNGIKDKEKKNKILKEMMTDFALENATWDNERPHILANSLDHPQFEEWVRKLAFQDKKPRFKMAGNYSFTNDLLPVLMEKHPDIFDEIMKDLLVDNVKKHQDNLSNYRQIANSIAKNIDDKDKALQLYIELNRKYYEAHSSKGWGSATEEMNWQIQDLFVNNVKERERFIAVLVKENNGKVAGILDKRDPAYSMLSGLEDMNYDERMKALNNIIDNGDLTPIVSPRVEQEKEFLKAFSSVSSQRELEDFFIKKKWELVEAFRSNNEVDKIFQEKLLKYYPNSLPTIFVDILSLEFYEANRSISGVQLDSFLNSYFKFYLNNYETMENWGRDFDRMLAALFPVRSPSEGMVDTFHTDRLEILIKNWETLKERWNFDDKGLYEVLGKHFKDAAFVSDRPDRFSSFKDRFLISVERVHGEGVKNSIANGIGIKPGLKGSCKSWIRGFFGKIRASI